MDLVRILRRATERAEKQLKEKMELDKAKIESLEAELARLQEEKAKYEEALAAKNMTFETSKS